MAYYVKTNMIAQYSLKSINEIYKDYQYSLEILPSGGGIPKTNLGNGQFSANLKILK